MELAVFSARNRQAAAVQAQSGIGHQLAESLTQRGWNLYLADRPVADLEAMRRIVRRGRSCPARPFQHYILLPSVVDPGDPELVLAAARGGRARYPFFVEKGRGGGETYYCIGGVMLTDEALLIGIDLDAMLFLGLPIPERLVAMEFPCMVIDVLEMAERLAQVTCAYRYSGLPV
ncbi:MAG: hypothetical protein ACOY8P_01615 [Thermodesulfobacteriota bacterium]